MLWEPGSNKNDGGEQKEGDSFSVTPILVPLQDKETTVEKNIPVLVPDVKDLKNQFQQQQNMILQLKETIIQNESQLNSKEKQIEVYANKLSQIKARNKNTQGRKLNSPDSIPKTLVKRDSRENLAKPESSNLIKSLVNSPKLGRKVKISELKKCLEENKIKFEQRTGKEQKETKKIEMLVEQLKTQLGERDKTIQELQKTIEQPKAKKSKQKSELVASKFTQTFQVCQLDESNEILALQKKIYDLEANVLDLEENLKEKESVIEARTQAVTLLSQDLSLKGKSTLENLEETRQEMRKMQNEFVAIENQLKQNLSDKESRLIDLEEKLAKLESTNFDLSSKNDELQEKLVKLQEKYAEVEAIRMSSTAENGGNSTENPLLKISLLTKELDDRNKAMIKMKIEHRNKLKSLNATLESIKQLSDDKAEIIRLSKLIEDLENTKIGLENRVAELEDEKGNHLLSILDVDDLKATEKKLKDQINELEVIIQKQNEDLSCHQTKIFTLENEKLDLMRSNQDQGVLIEDLYAKLMEFGGSDDDVGEKEKSKYNELRQQFEDMKYEYEKRLETLKIEHSKEIEMIESYYGSKIENSEKRELEEYRITTEIDNIHVEEQIELLIREKQQLLEKLKALSGVSLTDSLPFEKIERLDLKTDREAMSNLNKGVNTTIEKENESQVSNYQKMINDQQNLIEELKKSVEVEKEKVKFLETKILELDGNIKDLEDANAAFKDQLKAESSVECGKIQKSNFNAKNKVKKIEMELVDAKKKLLEQTQKIEDLNEKLKEKEEIIQKYIEKIEVFEKDDWDRQNHWKNTEESFENMEELQKKCLSLENSLLELNEQFERLRKENIEVVHLLSEEKVKRKKLLEELGKEEQNSGGYRYNLILEEKIQFLKDLLQNLEGKVKVLETTASENSFKYLNEEENWNQADLVQKLEWSNVVLTSKETEIFRLQNLLEDRNKIMENLKSDLNDCKMKLIENQKSFNTLTEQLEFKENKLQEVYLTVQSLNEQKDEAAKKLIDGDIKFQNLLSNFQKEKENLEKKTLEFQKMEDILGEKSLDIENLKIHLESSKIELTKNYEDKLANLLKCLRDKESEFEVVTSEMKNSEIALKDLMTEKEAIYNEKKIIENENEKLQRLLSEKDKSLNEVNEKLKKSMDNTDSKPSIQDMEDLKTKMKKLAANLKKKAQNEGDLLKQLKDLETIIAEKDKLMETTQTDLKDITEKWLLEKNEKDKVKNELDTIMNQKARLEDENVVLKEKVSILAQDLKDGESVHENRLKQLQEEIQRSSEASTEFQAMEQQYKDKISNLEKNFIDVVTYLETILSNLESTDQLLQREERKVTNKSELAKITDCNTDININYDEDIHNKSQIKNQLEKLEKIFEALFNEKTVFEAKLQENLAVIENLEMEAVKTQKHIKCVEEKLFNSEERRLLLENKNEEMYRKITEDSQNQIVIDDMTVRLDALLESEKSLQDIVKSLETNNTELKHSLDEAQSEIHILKKEAEITSEKIIELTDELKRLKDVDMEKNVTINSLSEEVVKRTAENKQVLEEYEKLNRDYEQFEVDYKESLENSQNVEKTLRHCIEELTGENASLLERLNLLMEERNIRSEKMKEEEIEDFKKPNKKYPNSQTDEIDFVKELKQPLHAQSGDLNLTEELISNFVEGLDEKEENVKDEISNIRSESSNDPPYNPEGKFSLESEHLVEFKESSIKKTDIKPLMENQSQKAEEKKFDANLFFSNNQNIQSDKSSFFDDGVKPRTPDDENMETAQISDFDSLMWDDGWGTTEHLEEEYSTKDIRDVGATTSESQKQFKIEALESEIYRLKAEVERLSKELQDQTIKYTKALKKLKLLKVVCDDLRAQLKSHKFENQENMGDLNATIMEEFKSRIQLMEKNEQEYLKTLQNYKAEKELLLKKIETLNVRSEKYLEMKERQNNDAEIWQRKNSQLLEEIAELRQKLEQPLSLSPGDNIFVQQNQELLNKVEALEWKNCELIHLVEEKEELLVKMSTGLPLKELEESGKTEKLVLQNEIKELKNVKELLEKKLSEEENKNLTALDKLNEQLTALTNENETLQDILGEMKAKGSAINDSKVVGFKQKIQELEESCKIKDLEINRLNDFAKQSNEELTNLRQQLLNLQSEKELDSNKYEESLLHLERNLRAKEEELKEITLKQKADEKAQNQFETIDLSENVKSVSPSKIESEDLIQKIIELESSIKVKEEILSMNSTLVQESNKEIDILRQKNSELEELLRSKETELNNLSLQSWNQEKENEIEKLMTEIRDLKEFLQFKENEILQMQTLKGIEIQNLNARILDLENLNKSKENQGCEGFEQQNLNILMSSEENFNILDLGNSNEMEALKQKISELETLSMEKSEKIEQLLSKLAELEKSYNDSKIEIERLLNEEKLNTEEKFVEPFQNNMQIPVAYELEAITRSLEEEKQKANNMQYALLVKEKVIDEKSEEIKILNKKVKDLENLLKMLSEVESRQRVMAEESYEMKAQLEKLIMDLQKELDCTNLQLRETRRELEQYQNSEDEIRSKLKSQIVELETILMESTEKKDSEILELKSILNEKTNFYEALLQSKKEEEEKLTEKALENVKLVESMKSEIEKLLIDLAEKEAEVSALTQLVNEERLQLEQATQFVEEREKEVMDLRQTLTSMQMEIASFRNFEKQVKELRMTQLKAAGSDVSVTPEGNPDLSGWTEHELAELSTKLQSDLDTAMYMLHQRDVRCDELTFELMQLIEERDTLQLRLSTALRINEELRSLEKTEKSNSSGSQEVKDLVDQANDRQVERPKIVPSEDLQQLANKISELHSISYLRDKTVKDDSVQRHTEQMNLLSRISDSDVSLGRDSQSTPTVLLNWMRGKSAPKVMHI